MPDVPQADVADALLKLIGSPDLSSRRWVWEQYDTLIRAIRCSFPAATPASCASTATRPRRSPSPPT
jgi:phosphoribosylformylglycinamidine (FGAM) synthase-like enzyme